MVGSILRPDKYNIAIGSSSLTFALMFGKVKDMRWDSFTEILNVGQITVLLLVFYKTLSIDVKTPN